MLALVQARRDLCVRQPADGELVLQAQAVADDQRFLEVSDALALPELGAVIETGLLDTSLAAARTRAYAACRATGSTRGQALLLDAAPAEAVLVEDAHRCTVQITIRATTSTDQLVMSATPDGGGDPSQPNATDVLMTVQRNGDVVLEGPLPALTCADGVTAAGEQLVVRILGPATTTEVLRLTPQGGAHLVEAARLPVESLRAQAVLAETDTTMTLELWRAGELCGGAFGTGETRIATAELTTSVFTARLVSAASTANTQDGNNNVTCLVMDDDEGCTTLPCGLEADCGENAASSTIALVDPLTLAIDGTFASQQAPFGGSASEYTVDVLVGAPGVLSLAATPGLQAALKSDGGPAFILVIGLGPPVVFVGGDDLATPNVPTASVDVGAGAVYRMRLLVTDFNYEGRALTVTFAPNP